jgi:hypothetical protein
MSTETLEAVSPQSVSPQSGSDVLKTKTAAVTTAFAGSHAKFAGFEASGPFIDLITQLLPTLLKLLGGCGMAAKNYSEVAARPGILGKWYRRRAANEVRGRADVDEEMVEPLVNALVKVGLATTAEEEQAILSA